MTLGGDGSVIIVVNELITALVNTLSRNAVSSFYMKDSSIILLLIFLP